MDEIDPRFAAAHYGHDLYSINNSVSYKESKVAMVIGDLKKIDGQLILDPAFEQHVRKMSKELILEMQECCSNLGTTPEDIIKYGMLTIFQKEYGALDEYHKEESMRNILMG